MNVRKLSVNKACIFLAVLLLAAMVTVSVALYALTQDITAVWYVLYIFRYTQPLEKWFLMQLFTILYFLCWLSQLLFYWSAWQLPS